MTILVTDGIRHWLRILNLQKNIKMKRLQCLIFMSDKKNKEFYGKLFSWYEEN